MKLTPTDNKLIAISSVLGTIQGLAWLCMSFSCFVFYYGKRIEFSIATYMDTISSTMYYLYLQKDDFLFEDQIFTGIPFLSFMTIHFLFNSLWVAISLSVTVQTGKNLANRLRLWGGVTVLTFLWDFLTFIVLTVDYSACMRSNPARNGDDKIAYEMLCANGILIPLVISARGFVLWIVNLSFAFVSIKLAKKVLLELSMQHETRREVELGPDILTLAPPPSYDEVFLNQAVAARNFNLNIRSN